MTPVCASCFAELHRSPTFVLKGEPAHLCLACWLGHIDAASNRKTGGQP